MSCRENEPFSFVMEGKNYKIYIQFVYLPSFGRNDYCTCNYSELHALAPSINKAPLFHAVSLP